MESPKRIYHSRKHQPFRLPPELKEFNERNPGAPFYILVACWAFLKGTPVTVRDVREEFQVSLRRASDLLEYLTEHGTDTVHAECVLIPAAQGSKCVRRAWTVFKVNFRPFLGSKKMNQDSADILVSAVGNLLSQECKKQSFINDELAMELERAYFWRRAAARWFEVLQYCDTEEQQEWIIRRRRYCFDNMRRSDGDNTISESTE